MPSPESERVTCPKCGKGYRWQPALVGTSVPCKQCGTTFDIPDQPGKGILPQPADADIYELAEDPDDKPDLPPAYVPPKSTPADEHNEPSVQPPERTAPPDATSDAQDTSPDDASEPIVHVSEAKKAARREEQRLAAAELEAQGSWRDYKWLIIVATLLVLFGILYWAMLAFSDAVDEGLHKTMLDRPTDHAYFEPPHPVETR